MTTIAFPDSDGSLSGRRAQTGRRPVSAGARRTRLWLEYTASDTGTTERVAPRCAAPESTWPHQRADTVDSQ
jgi:hypothetical protein